MASEGNSACIPVRVAIRCRPLSNKEQREGCQMCVNFVNDEPQIIVGLDRPFTYDFVFPPTVEQRETYDASIKPLINNVFKGYNATILAYGQTGSGKTYTMGTVLSSNNDMSGDELGIIPRAINDLFAEIHLRAPMEFSVKVSFLEVYKEDILDLLSPMGRREEVTIREDYHGGIKLVGLNEIAVVSSQEALQCLEQGSRSRMTATTAMNVASSRSHAIFTVIIQCKGKDMAMSSKFHFVDLAGSERAKKTGAEGDRFKEGVNINLGLLALGNVISALSEGRARGHVPYRETKLTRLLQDSLGGNSHTVMVACISPADSNYEETLNTLRYAHRARKITNKPIINRDPQTAEIMRLKNLVQQLQLQIMNSRDESSCAGTGPAATREVKMLRVENSALKGDNENLTRELQHAIEQMTALYEKAFVAEVSRDTIKQKLEELRQKTKMTMESFNQSLNLSGDPKLKEQLELFKGLGDKIIEIQTEQVKPDEPLAECDGSQLVGDVEAQAEDGGALTNEMSTEITFRQVKMNRELQEINKMLAMKEELAGRLTMSDDKYTTMKDNYEKLMCDLEAEITNLQKEKEELNQALTAVKVNAACSKVSEQRRKRVQELESHIAELRKKISECSKLSKLKEQSDEQVRKLAGEIQQLKQARVRLVRQMKSEADRLRVWKQQKEKEVCQLRQKDRKRQCELARKEQQFTMKQTVMRIKMEEAVSANKRLKEALARQKQSADQRRQERERTALQKSRLASDPQVVKQRIVEWLSQELELVVSAREARYHLESLMKDRTVISIELNKLLQVAEGGSSTDTEPQGSTSEDVADKIKELTNDMELRNVQIFDLQQKISDADQEEKGKTRFDHFQTMIEAKVALRWLFQTAISTKVDLVLKNASFQELSQSLEEALDAIEKLQAQLEKAVVDHEEELIRLKQEHEDKILYLLNQLNTPNRSSEAYDESAEVKLLRDRLMIQEEQLKKLSQVKVELLATKAECQKQRDELLEYKLLGPAPLKEFLEPKAQATGTSMMKFASSSKGGCRRMTVAEFFADSPEQSTEMDSENDPDWRNTPLMKRIKKMKSRKFEHVQPSMDSSSSDSDDSATKPKRKSSSMRCRCKKTNCTTLICCCKKQGSMCSENCECPPMCNNKVSS